MTELLMTPLKIALGIFMAGNLLNMGLRLRLGAIQVGLRDSRFVTLSLLWCFVLGPAAAYLLTLVMPLERPYAIGLILIGVAPCAPFLPVMVGRARGDLDYAASFMLLAAGGMVATMPLVVPLLAGGLSIGAWAIARPLLTMVLMPLAVGMAILRASPAIAARLQPIVRKTTVVATIVMLGLCIVIYGRGFISSAGSYAALAQAIFLTLVTTGSYALAFGLTPERRSVLSLGVCTRNLGAAFAPLLAASGVDERAIIMIALGVPLQTIAALVAARLFAASAGAADAATGREPRR